MTSIGKTPTNFWGMFIDAAVFEVSTPSLGTGIEIAHTYLRPRLGLPAIPMLAVGATLLVRFLRNYPIQEAQ